MSTPAHQTPDWDLEQLEVILEEPSSWQLVIAGPGAGKSAVACQRLAYLIDEGIPPSRMLLVSFTRTAVAELRDRIVQYAVAGDRARSVRISTIDSHAWSLRAGFDDEPIAKVFGDGSYDLSIVRTVELLRQQQPDLCDFMGRLEHLIIDEAQDVMGVRADLVIELLRSLSDECGVTILADPAQAIYGFTTDGQDQRPEEASLLWRLAEECPRPLFPRDLKEIHRIENGSLVDLFVRTRREIEQADTPSGHVERVQDAIRSTCGMDVGVAGYSSIAAFLGQAGETSMLVLFRRRADVLFASSYCSDAGVQHRLRMSELPVVVRPCIGWLFGEYVAAVITREAFDELWEVRGSIAPEPLAGEDRDKCWNLLHRLAAGGRPGTIDMVQLRRIVSRPRPPVEICYPDVGATGPILGTIHASKGREADTVVLVMPPASDTGVAVSGGREGAMVFEEGRVYYVGATRARKMLIAADNNSTRVGYLESGRVYRNVRERRVQIEVGRAGDVDRIAHLAWSNCLENQRTLAACVGRTLPVKARTFAEHDYASRLILEQIDGDGVTRSREVGQMSASFRSDTGKIWGLVDPDEKLKPAPEMRHLYIIAVSTVGLSEAEIGAAKPPFNRSGLALAPVVKGFPMVPFFFRQARKRRRYE
ncbi:MAG: UvrD family DEAD/DEAH box helicase [Dehalococcoidia bacterium]